MKNKEFYKLRVRTFPKENSKHGVARYGAPVVRLKTNHQKICNTISHWSFLHFTCSWKVQLLRIEFIRIYAKLFLWNSRESTLFEFVTQHLETRGMYMKCGKRYVLQRVITTRQMITNINKLWCCRERSVGYFFLCSFSCPCQISDHPIAHLFLCCFLCSRLFFPAGISSSFVFLIPFFPSHHFPRCSW